MDFFLSTAFLKYEIVFLGVNLLYLVFHFSHSLVISYYRIRDFLKPKKAKPMPSIAPNADAAVVTETPSKSNIIEAQEIEESVLDHLLTSDEKQYLSELVKLIKTKMARGEYQEARLRIIEGLSIEKFNKDLNCLLASLYEKEKDFKKAELIYKDLIMLYDADPEIYLKLGFALSIQGKYEIAYEIYRKLLILDEGSEETVEMLANIGHQLARWSESTEYARIFLKKHPHNIDILTLVAVNSIELELRHDALEALKKIRTFEPYNTKVNELIKKVELELELEQNFHANEEK